MAVEKPPTRLGAAGGRLWKATLEEYELAEHEQGLLLQACQTLDAIGDLQKALTRDGVLNEGTQGVRVHPTLPELRQQRITLARLIAVLGLEAGVIDDAAAPKHQKRATRGTYGITGAVS